MHPIRVNKTGSEKSMIVLIPFQSIRGENELIEFVLGSKTPNTQTEGDETNQYCDQNRFLCVSFQSKDRLFG